MKKEYYFISDLHIGGDGDLNAVSFQDELIIFLKKLEDKDKRTELIIAGDAFGLWEKTSTNPIKSLMQIIKTHKKIFNQFIKTGSKVKITLIPGNHDYELACYPEFKTLLKKYNINLEQKLAIKRNIAGKHIWIEHGHQHDAYNRIEDFGNPKSKSAGYYFTKKIINNAVRHSVKGRDKWLKDIESVYPNENVANWITSNYFYKEMNFLLRDIIAPFSILFNATILATLVAMIVSGIVNSEFLALFHIIGEYGIFGKIFEILIFFNLFIFGIASIISIPAYFIVKDIKHSMYRYGLDTKHDLRVQKEDKYTRAAEEVFEKSPNTAIFVYGHTHNPSLRKYRGKYILNTGTWLKRLTRVKSRFKLLPDVYYPSYHLNYFKIIEDDGKIVIEFKKIDKVVENDLTFFQKVVTFKRKIVASQRIPKRTEIALD